MMPISIPRLWVEAPALHIVRTERMPVCRRRADGAAVCGKIAQAPDAALGSPAPCQFSILW